MSYDAPPLPPPVVPPPAYLPPPSGGANAALALGIVGLVCNLASCCCCLATLPGLCSPIAWWKGARELRAIRDGHASPGGASNARTGMICGIAGTAILLLYVLGMAAYVAVVGFAAATEAMKDGGIPVR